MVHTDIAAMPVAERIALMESLWESLSHDDAAASAVPAWHADELARRAALLDQGQESISAWDEAKQRLRDQAAGRK